MILYVGPRLAEEHCLCKPIQSTWGRGDTTGQGQEVEADVGEVRGEGTDIVDYSSISKVFGHPVTLYTHVQLQEYSTVSDITSFGDAVPRNRTASYTLRLREFRYVYQEKKIEKLIQTAANLSATVAHRCFWYRVTRVVPTIVKLVEHCSCLINTSCG